MQSLRRLSAALLAAAFVALSAGAAAAAVDVPGWVPPEYAKFFVRHVETRPAWERALNYVNVTVGESGQSFALVAGISKYPRMASRAGDLWPARLDVEKMTAYLAGEPESFNEIVVLLDEDMTAENLRYFLTQYFPRRLAESPRSRFLFAYSGHGMTAANGRGYLLTSEATSLEDRYNGISFATLRAQFQDIVDAGHQVLALINACYGVDFHRLSLAFGGEADAPLPMREGAHAITAGGSGELTWSDQSFGEGDGPKGSIFFEGVFAALDGRADKLPADGIVTVGELETYLRNTVSRFTEQKQNPTGGDLIATTSPGGFFFLDRNRQIEKGNATPLEGEWWGGVSFGAVPPTATPTTRQVASADAAGGEIAQLVGRWEGEAVEPGGFRFPVELEITEGCAMHEACGTIAVPHVPCRGDITLIDFPKGRYEFDVSNFDATSDKSVCQPGAGEVIEPLPDGTLRYTAMYSGAEGILHRR